MLKKDSWDPGFSKQRPYFQVLEREFSHYYSSFEDWPTLEDYNRWGQACQSVEVASPPKRFVEQQPRHIHHQDFFQCYEPRIFLNHEVQTRTENWHDFFNMLCWFLFPRTKRIMNRFQFIEQTQRQRQGIGQRTWLENKLTHFDEFGLIIASSDAQWIDAIKSHQWKKLFFSDPRRCQEKVKLYILGHAIYERLLNPFIGLTAKSLIINVQEDFFQQTFKEQQQSIDQWAEQQIRDKKLQLHPFPILGYPTWHQNQDSDFYDNVQYFRPKRVKQAIKKEAISESSNQ